MPFDLSSSPAGFSPCSTAFAACMDGPESYCIPLPQIIGHVCIYIIIIMMIIIIICVYVYVYHSICIYRNICIYHDICVYQNICV